MALVYDVENIPAVISAGNALSAVVKLGAKVIIGFSLPTGWTPGVITFQASADGVNFQELYDMAGNPIQIASASTAASAFVYLDPSFWRGVNMIKLRSGTASVPVNQASAASIGVLVRSEA